MNIHVALDHLTIGLSALALGRSGFFDRSVESPGFGEQLSGISLEFPEINGEGHYEIEAQTPAGTLDPALHVVQWRGQGYPTIIYHHGGFERPFDYGRLSKNTFKNVLLSQRHLIEANLINLRAAFHRDVKRFSRMRCVRALSDFTAMLSVSVKLIEGAVSLVRSWRGGRVIVSGISLGGWAANLHRAYCNSADAYVPMLAGAALGDVFITSAYRVMSGRLAREHAETIRSVLNFEADHLRVTDENTFPLLALYDQIVQYGRQKECYGAAPIRVLKKGHATGARAHGALRRHILERL
jgi:hypothetical protein